jgi:hypothetical protein
MMIRITVAIAAALAVAVTACGASTSTSGTSTFTAPATPVHSVQAPPMPVSPSAAVLASRLKAAGLPVTSLIVYNAVTDPNHLLGRQGGYSSKVAWADPRAEAAGAGQEPTSGPDRGDVSYGGGIEVFPDVASAYARYQELKAFTAPIGDGYDYLDGTAVLRLSQYLIPGQARACAAAFRAAVA